MQISAQSCQFPVEYKSGWSQIPYTDSIFCPKRTPIEQLLKQFNCKHIHSSRVVLRESENEFTVILQIMLARYPHHCVL